MGEAGGIRGWREREVVGGVRGGGTGVGGTGR